jgi:hypothetical protein
MILFLALSQTLYDFAKTTETQVDCLKLEHVSLVHNLFFVDFLWTCQVA